jgi:hypothetical protein
MTDNSERGSLVAKLLFGGAILLALILVVLTAEVAMTPPPFARGGAPAIPFAGEWKGFATALVDNQEVDLPIDLRIKADGAVTGSVGSSQMRARFERNRSWLGRELNIRTDYIILGEARDYPGTPKSGVGESMAMPLNLEDGYLKGSLIVGSRGPARVTLFRVPIATGEARVFYF